MLMCDICGRTSRASLRADGISYCKDARPVIKWRRSLDFDVDFAVVEGEADEPVDAYERQGVDEGRQRLVAGEWHEQVVVSGKHLRPRNMASTHATE